MDGSSSPLAGHNLIRSKDHRERNPGATIRRDLESLLVDAGVPGAAVALVVDGKNELSIGAGRTEHNISPSLDSDARFYTYSFTKTLLATATLQLVERGHIDLDAAIQAYLPTAPFESPVRVRQVLNHTGGVPDYGALAEYKSAVRMRPGRPWTVDDYYRYSNARQLRFQPGESWSYSNVGYMIVRLMLEEVSGRSLGALLGELIFEPLGLDRTSVAASLEDACVLTPGYSRSFTDDGSLIDISGTYHPGWVAHGVVISTASETARILDAVFNGELIGRESLAAMLEAVPVPGEHPLFEQPSYGLGLMIDAAISPGILAGHSGEGPGYSIAAFHHETPGEHRIGAVVFANRDIPDLGLQIALDLIAAVRDTLA